MTAHPWEIQRDARLAIGLVLGPAQSWIVDADGPVVTLGELQTLTEQLTDEQRAAPSQHQPGRSVGDRLVFLWERLATIPAETAASVKSHGDQPVSMWTERIAAELLEVGLLSLPEPAP